MIFRTSDVCIETRLMRVYAGDLAPHPQHGRGPSSAYCVPKNMFPFSLAPHEPRTNQRLAICGPSSVAPRSNARVTNRPMLNQAYATSYARASLPHEMLCARLCAKWHPASKSYARGYARARGPGLKSCAAAPPAQNIMRGLCAELCADPQVMRGTLCESTYPPVAQYLK